MPFAALTRRTSIETTIALHLTSRIQDTRRTLPSLAPEIRGRSGLYLDRPLFDRVRDLFQSRVVALVLAQDRPLRGGARLQYYLRITRYLPLTTVNVYSLLPYLVVGKKLQGLEMGQPPLP
jgi:hypothetical protein